MSTISLDEEPRRHSSPNISQSILFFGLFPSLFAAFAVCMLALAGMVQLYS